MGYSLGNSTLKENDYSRFNMRLNTDINISRKLNVRFDASYSDVDRSLRDDGAPANPLGTVITSPGFISLAKAPFLSPYAYDKHGKLSHYLAEADDYFEGKFQGRGRLANPTSILEEGDGKNRNSFGNRLIMFAITPKFQFNRHLDLREHFVLGLVNTNENYYLPIQGVPTFVVDGLDEDTQLNNIVTEHGCPPDRHPERHPRDMAEQLRAHNICRQGRSALPQQQLQQHLAAGLQLR